MNRSKKNNNKDYNKNFINKIYNDYYCHIWRIKGHSHSTDHCKYNLLIKENNKSNANNNKNYEIVNNKNKNSSKGYNKNSYHSIDIIDNNKKMIIVKTLTIILLKIMLIMKMKWILISQEIFQSFKTLMTQ